MSIIKSKSKQAFEHNIKTELESGKPKDQSLAIAYSVKRKPKKKKMAEGGYVNDSAKTEHRPMPQEKDQDSKMISRNDSKKPLMDPGVLDQPTVKQAQKPSHTPLSRPKMANGILKVRDRADAEKEEALMSAMPPASPKEQPDRELDEKGPDRQGPSTPALKMKKMAEGGMINKEVSMKQAEEDEVIHPAGLESDNDQMRPPEDEYMSNHFAFGGSIEDEEIMEHEDSIAAAIMAKRERQKQLHSDSDVDRMTMMAEGGYLNGEDSIYSDDSSQADLSRNAEEDKNMEDQSSFDAMRKENYSESDGLRQLDSPMDSNEHGHDLSDEDSHDMVDQIRSQMNRKRQFKVR